MRFHKAIHSEFSIKSGSVSCQIDVALTLDCFVKLRALIKWLDFEEKGLDKDYSDVNLIHFHGRFHATQINPIQLNTCINLF